MTAASALASLSHPCCDCAAPASFRSIRCLSCADVHNRLLKRIRDRARPAKPRPVLPKPMPPRKPSVVLCYRQEPMADRRSWYCEAHSVNVVLGFACPSCLDVRRAHG